MLAGTSGFAYPSWAPTFYPPGLPARSYLAHYAARLPAVELNNTFYARPTAARVGTWIEGTPEGFRFVVKAQRGSVGRAMSPDAEASVAWLTEPLGGFGGRLGAVLFHIPDNATRDDARLGALLGAWPPTIPLVVEARHPSWHADETFGALREAGAVLCTTDEDEADNADDRPRLPDVRRTGGFLYLRLRRAVYTGADLDAWARRLVPFLDDGLDAYVVFRHDEDGANALRAEGFAARVEAARSAG